jgi:exoribonuclease II
LSDTLVPLKEGAVVAFLEKSELFLGFLVGSKGSSLRLLCHDQRERVLPQRRVLTQCGSLPPGTAREHVLHRLEKLNTHILELAEGIDLPTLWEALSDQTELMEPRDLAVQWFGPGTTMEQAVAMTWAVLQESVRFKLKGLHVKIQPREVVEQKLHQIEETARRERHLRESLVWIGGGSPPEHAAELVAQLKEVALFGSQAPRFAEIRDLLHKLGPADHEASVAFQALVSIGIWDKDENLDLLREGVPLEPDPEVLLAAERASSKSWDPAHRIDWSGRETFSIDPASTLDVDDALTCWQQGDRLMVAIHITDVTEFVELDQALDLDARMRGLSIYLPNRIIPMLPPVVSEQAASLLPGVSRPAITLVFAAAPDGTMLEPRFELSTIRITRKLSYVDVDRLLPQDALLQSLLEFCLARRQQRIAAGAVVLPLPEVNIGVGADDRVRIRLEPDTASHQLVAELMICFNASVAQLCRERGVPALYRGQPEPRRRIIVGAQPTLLECLLQRRQMLRSTTGLEPSRHSGLGLDAYTMATSPLRRYLDLCMEWQLRGVVLDQPPLLDPKRLEELMPYLSLAQRRVHRIERSTHRFWMCRWIEQRAEPMAQAVWLEPMAGRERAALLPFLTEVDVALQGHKAPKKGTLVELEVIRVRAREDELELALRGPAKQLDPSNEPLAGLLAGP